MTLKKLFWETASFPIGFGLLLAAGAYNKTQGTREDFLCTVIAYLVFVTCVTLIMMPVVYLIKRLKK